MTLQKASSGAWRIAIAALGAVTLLVVPARAQAQSWQRVGTVNNATVTSTAICNWNSAGYLECPTANPKISGGNLGIGTSAPGTALDLNGAMTYRGMAAPSVSAAGQGIIYFDSTANKFKVSENAGAYTNLVSTSTLSGGSAGYAAVWSSSSALTYDSSLFVDTTNHRVGIGITSPGAPLQITSGGAGELIRLGNTGGYAYASISWDGVYGILTFAGGNAERGITFNEGNGGFTVNTSGNAQTKIQTAGTTRMVIDGPSGGNVGIGTSSPGKALDVVGQMRSTSDITVDAGSGNANATINLTGRNAGTANTSTLWSDWGGTLKMQSSGFVMQNLSSTPYFTINSGGNVAIGNITPGTALDLNGAFSVRGMAAPSVSAAGQGRIYFDSTSNTFKVSQNGGAYADLVGGGGGSGTVSSGTAGQMAYYTGATTVGSAAAVTYATSGSLLTLTAQAATDKPLIVKAAASQSANLQEWQNSSGTALGTITSAGGAYFAGNVGIGTSAPGYALDVNGAINLTSTIRFSGGNSIDVTGNYLRLYNASGVKVINNAGTNTNLIIQDAGNVGIGTATPLSLLSVGPNNEFQVASSGNLSWASTVAPSIGITSPTTDVAANTLTINGQGAYSSAVTNGNGGSVLIQGGSFVGNRWSTSNGVILKESSSVNDQLEVRSIGYNSGVLLYPSTSGSISALALGGNIICMGQGMSSGHSSGCTSTEHDNDSFLRIINGGTASVEVIPGQNMPLTIKAGFGNGGGSSGPQSAANLTLLGGDSQASTNAGIPAVAGVGGSVYIGGGLGGLSQNGAVQGNGGTVFIYGGSIAGSGSGGSVGNVILAHNGTSAIGNVGIGTTSPDAPLTVVGTTIYSGINVKNASYPIAQLLGLGTGNDNGGLALYNANTKNVQVAASGSTFFNGGNVGIGTTAPGTALDLNGAMTYRGMAAPSVSAAGQGIIYFDSTANVFKVSQNGGAYTNLVGGAGGASWGTVDGGTVTTSTPYIFQQTWNAGAVAFTGIKENITDTASAATSLLMDLQVGGTSKFKIDKSGNIYVNGTYQLYDGAGNLYSSAPIGYPSVGMIGNGNGMLAGVSTGLHLISTAGVAWSSTTNWYDTKDLVLSRAAAANLRLGAGAAAAPVAQTLSVQNVVAGTTNTAGADFTITGSQGTGTGTGGAIVFKTAPAGSTGTAQNALATAMTITGAGNVGIGTTVAPVPLMVSNYGASIVDSDYCGTTYVNAFFGQAAPADVNSGNSIVLGPGCSGNNPFIRFRASGQDKGYLGWEPSQASFFINVAGTNNAPFKIKTAGVDRMTFPYAGGVGIGTSAPGTALDLNGAMTYRGMAAPSVSAAGQGIIYFDSTANVFKVSQNGGAYTNLVGGAGGASWGTVDGGTVTTSTPYIFQQTWNSAGVTFTGVKVNITDTASVAGSPLLDLQVGGTSKFSVDKGGNARGRAYYSNGNIELNGYDTSSAANGILYMNSTAAVAWGSTLYGRDTYLSRGGAANLRLGGAIDLAAPVAQTLSVQNVVAGTTNTAGADFTIAGSQGTGTGAGGAIVFKTAPAGSTGTAQNALATAMTITGAGSVGIGTATPLAQLDIRAGDMRIGGDGSDRRIYAYSSDGAIRSELFAYSGAGGYVGTFTNNPFYIRTNDTNRISIDATGNVGVGLNAPGSMFQVTGNAAIGYASSTAGPSNGLAVSGNVGIGTTSPQAALHINTPNAATSGYIRSVQNYLNANPSGAGTANFQAAYNQVDVSSNSASTAVGAYNLVQNQGSGTTSTVQGSFNWGVNTSTTGSVGTLYGAVNQAATNPSTTTTTAYGAYNNFGNSGTMTTGYGAYNYGTSDGTISNLYGSYNISYYVKAAGTVSALYGSYSIAQNNNTGTATAAYGVRSDISNSNATGSMTNAYNFYSSASNSGTIGTWYGLYVAAASGGTITTKHPVWVLDTGDSYFAGNIGIGTTAPGTALDLNGAQTFRGMAAPSVSAAGQGIIYFDSTANVFKVSQNGGAYTNLVGGAGGSPGGSTTQIQYNNAGAFAGAAAMTYATSGSLLTLTAQAATDKPLIVKGAASQSANLMEFQNSSGTALTTVSSAGAVAIGSTLTVTGDAAIDGTTLKVDSTNHRVGVGTASPTKAMEVKLSAAPTAITTANWLRVDYAGGATLIGSDYLQSLIQAADNTNAASSILLNPFGGKVGIGLAPGNTPNSLLDVAASGGGTGSNVGITVRAGNSTGYFGNSQLGFGWAGGTTYMHSIKTRHNSAAAAGNAIDFYLWNYGVDTSTTLGTKQVMTLDGTGNVGIGTTAPGTALDVNGAQTFRGMAAPSVSAAGQGIIYFDSTANVFKVSQNGGAYANLVGGAGGSPGGSTTQVQFNNSGAFAGDSGFTYDSTNKAITLGGATVTTSNPFLNMTQTWNASGVTFTGMKMNITNTASNASSLMFDFQKGGVSAFSGNIWGDFVAGGSVNAGSGSIITYGGVVSVKSSGQIGFYNAGVVNSSSYGPDTMFTRAAAANMHLGAADAAAPVAQTLGVQGVVAGTTNTAGTDFTIAGSQGTGTGAGGAIVFKTAPAGSTGTAQNALAEAVRITSAGSVGIGTTAPASTLHVVGTEVRLQNDNAYYSFMNSAGTARNGYLQFTQSFGTINEANSVPFVFQIANVEKVRFDSNGNVGIGTTVPGTILDINGAQTFRGMAAPSVSAAGQGIIYFDSTANVFKVSQNGGAYANLVGGAGGASWGTVDGGTVTTSNPYIFQQTWNAGAVAFTGLKANFTNTASATGSMLLDLQVGGTSQLAVHKDGTIQGPAYSGFRPYLVPAIYGWNIGTTNSNTFNAPAFGFDPGSNRFYLYSSNGSIWFNDTMIGRAAAGNIRLGDTAAAAPVAQTLSVQNVLAGTTNTAGADFTIAGSQGTGTGAGGAIVFKTAPAGSTGTAQNALATAMTITSAGSVGIGTATPAQKFTVVGGNLSVAGADDYTGYLEITGQTGLHNTRIISDAYQQHIRASGSNALSLETNGSSTSKLWIAQGGNIGIGTNAPAALLHLSGNRSSTSWTTTGIALANDAATYTDTSSTAASTVATRAANSLGIPTLASNNAITVTNAANLYIAGAPAAGTNTTITNATALYVAAGNSYFGGNVGIGTTAPQSTLDVNGNISLPAGNDYRPSFLTTGYLKMGIWRMYQYNGTIQFDNGTNVYASFGTFAGGYFGYRTVSNGQFAWTSTGDSSGTLDTAVSRGAAGKVYIGTSASNTDYSGTLIAANIGIGTTAPAAALHVVGDIQYTGVITDISDIRLKQDIAPLGSSLEKILQLNPVSFRMKANPSVLEFGFIAQEVEKLMPDLVKTANDKDGTKSLNYTGMIAPLVKSVQELAATVQELKKENEALKARLQTLETKH